MSMTLHIFNPEHDLALAFGLANFTAPHAGRQLRHDLGFLPALWAETGDVVMVDDVDEAANGWKRLKARLKALEGTGTLKASNPEFQGFKPGVSRLQTQSVQPWGWDAAIRARLLRSGVPQDKMPTEAEIETVRQLSHRQVAARLLSELKFKGTVGDVHQCHTRQEVAEHVNFMVRSVLKAPWSSSGRGLRFCDIRRTAPTDLELYEGWIRNVLANQGSIMVEQYYNKVKDFGMEFWSDGEGNVSFEGLSLFQTENGAYTGNILATESAKIQDISRYIPVELLDSVQQNICSYTGTLFQGKYRGPFGVDMMVVPARSGESFLLHPCVEINLRRTMGHVALAVERLLNPTEDDERRHVMRIEWTDNHYKLIIKQA